MINIDDFVKSPSASLRGILRHCGVPKSTPHSSGFARLASESFYKVIPILTFYETINIDYFKKYNDRYGHQAGDACLQAVAGILKAQIGRSHDILARFGGDKFACLLPDVYFDGALQKAEAMVRTVHDRGLPHTSSEAASVVSISMGVVATIPGPDRQPNELVSIVETQLNEARRQGRNRVCGRELSGYFSNSLK